MSHPAPLYFADERPVRLGPRIGKGGEGEVFAREDVPGEAVKLYDPAGAARREAKIAAMVDAGLADRAPIVAFPRALVRDRTRRFAGFVMPKIDGAEPLHELYAPGPRKQRFPEADFRFLVRVALNSARAVAATHEAGCVIGDINHSGFLIGRDGRVALIDADSFAFTAGAVRYPCHVGVPEYTAPELAGRNLAEAVRTANHDAFGLAIVLFQLLFMGRHPFAGVPSDGDVTIPEAIADHRFAYSRVRRTGLAPPTGTGRLDDVPAAVADLFERAFAPEGVAGRPTAVEWADALAGMERALAACPASLRHHFPESAPECPWCRMEGTTGTPLFLLPGRLPGDGDGLGLDLALPPFDPVAVRKRLEAHPTPDVFVYAPPMPEAIPEPPRRSRWPDMTRLLGGSGMLALAGVNVGLIPQNWLMSVPVLVAGVAWVRESVRPDRAPRNELLDVDSRLSRAFLNLQAGADIEGAFLARAQVEALIAERAALPHRLAEMERAFQAERLAAARRRHLERVRLALAEIPGVGPDARARLAAAGVETAAAVEERDLARIAALTADEAAAVTAWAAGHGARFRPDPVLDGAERADFARRYGDLVADAAALESRLEAEIERLAGLSAAVEAARTARVEAIDRLLARRIMLAREIEALGCTPPPLRAPPPRPIREDTRRMAQAIRKGLRP